MGGVEYGTGRQALLDAAIKVVAGQGLRGLTYRSVAAEAGVTHGAVRYHFGDWNTLVEEALALSVERSVAGAELTAEAPSFAASLPAAVAADPDTQAFQFELALAARRRPELQAALERVYDTYRDVVRAALARHGIPEDPDLTAAILAWVDGLVFHQTVFGDTAQTERSFAKLDQVIALFAADHSSRP